MVVLNVNRAEDVTGLPQTECSWKQSCVFFGKIMNYKQKIRIFKSTFDLAWYHLKSDEHKINVVSLFQNISSAFASALSKTERQTYHIKVTGNFLHYAAYTAF